MNVETYLFGIFSIGSLQCKLFIRMLKEEKRTIHFKNTNKMINVEKKEMICPRCMGKGFVDLDDIRRLGKN